MPELPEVQTTVTGLKKKIVGKTIKEVWSDFHVGAKHRNKENLKNKKFYEKFKKVVKGAKIKSLERRGKNILIHLNPSTSSGRVAYTIVIHMKMTGHFMTEGYEKEKKFVHLIFSLSGGKKLALADMRKFASITLPQTDELEKHDVVGKLGPDPFDSKLTPQKFSEIIHQKGRMPIKSVLMDQNVIAGIGNIYSDEILWQAGVHPLSRAGGIPQKKVGEIFRAMRKILKFSIKKGGDSTSDYRNASGKKGRFQNFHRAYQKNREKCQKNGCSGIIKRMVIKGRSAHFCPKHQIKYG